MTYLKNVTITQDATIDSLNTFSGSLAAGATWSGSPTSTLGVAAIQVSLYTNQNCTLYVDQSPDGSNWDLSDDFKYYSGVNNLGLTVQAINSYFRVRLKNETSFSASPVRLQSVLCPIVEAIPRSLTESGNLKVGIEEFTDTYGFGVENTPNDEMRVVTPYRLVGSTFSGSTLDTNFWTSGSGSGSSVVANGHVTVTTGSLANGGTSLQSVRSGRYIGSNSNRARMVIRISDTGSANNVRRWGAFTTTDGCFFELSETTFKVVTRKTGVDTPVASGSFNGQWGSTYTLDTNVKTWEIYWNNSKVFFTTGGHVIHTVSANTTTWSDTTTLPLRFENNNFGSSTSVLQLGIRSATITRLGNYLSQPTSYYQPLAQNAGTNLKIGAGNLHSVVFGGFINGAVFTLSDSTSGSSPVIFSSSLTSANNTAGVPVSIDFKGLPFFTGLRLTVTSANASATIIYE
jgi:hypothetical protein